MNRVVIVGGGASGLMAAIWAAAEGSVVTLLEQNERTGKKILATGNGRCNLTNMYQDPSCYRSSQPEYPWKIISQFPYQETLQFFAKLGIYTKNRNGWMYPYSDQAASVAEVLEQEARHRKVKIKTKERVKEILSLTSGYQVVTETWKYDCDRVILACGSPASAVEGSSDTGFQIAKALGHRVVPPLPALVSLKGKGNYFGKWAGCRMEGQVSLEVESGLFYKERGEILFTEYGISGICVFQISRYAVRAIQEGKKVTCHLDLMPDFAKETLVSFLKQRRENCPYKSMQESLVGLLPKKMIPILAPAKATEETVAANLKNWEIPIRDGHSLKQAQVCSGGVCTEELTKELESRLHPGIYFCGETVDVDGPCGGYNLQWAWSSGAVAGRAAGRK